MKNCAKMIAALVLVFFAVTGAFASDFTKGKVKKIDAKSGKVTIIHEELTLASGGDAMPAMTMVFRVADDTMLEKMAEGQDIEFVADRVKGKLTVTEIKE